MTPARRSAAPTPGVPLFHPCAGTGFATCVIARIRHQMPAWCGHLRVTGDALGDLGRV